MSDSNQSDRNRDSKSDIIFAIAISFATVVAVV